MDNEAEFNKLNDKIKELEQKNNDFEQKIEALQANIKALDIMTMFKDDGSGTIDATKVMVKALQEKVFKKFELVEKRYKKEWMENFKTKTAVENLIPRIDQINHELGKINELNNERKEEFVNYKKNNEEINNELKNNLNNDIKSKMVKLKDEINSVMNNKLLAIEEKLKILDALEISSINSGLEKENIKMLEKK